MAKPAYLSVKNYDKYQRYKDRHQKWIKLHYSLLDDAAFLMLDEVNQARYMKLLLVASRCGNRILNDAHYLATMLRCREAIDLTPLIKGGFLVRFRPIPVVIVDTIDPRSENQDPRAKNQEKEEEEEEKSLVELTPDPLPGEYVVSLARWKDAEGVMHFLNEKTGKHFPLRTPKGEPTTNLSTIQQRLKDGYTVLQCRQIIALKTREWSGGQTKEGKPMDLYLRPQTLFSKKNFETYLGELHHAV